jgi:hypothetical protein
MLHVGQAGAQFVAHPPRRRRRNVLHPQHHQRVDDDQERQRVEEEAGVHRLRFAVAPLAERRQREPEGERTEHARDVELNRVQRHRVRQIFLVDERWDERLVRRSAERLRAAGDERQHKDLPDLHHVHEHQQGQYSRGAHLHDLRRDERAPAIVAVGEDAADERKQDDRQLLQERIEPEEERRVRQRNDEPVLRDDLHPRADARGAGANPLDTEIAVGEGGQHPAQRALAHRRGGSGGCVGSGGRRGLCVDGFGQETVLNQ